MNIRRNNARKRRATLNLNLNDSLCIVACRRRALTLLGCICIFCNPHRFTGSLKKKTHSNFVYNISLCVCVQHIETFCQTQCGQVLAGEKIYDDDDDHDASDTINGWYIFVTPVTKLINIL